MENPENLLECLKREFLEETGYVIEHTMNLGTYDFLTDSSYDGFQYTHHIAIMYEVQVAKQVNGALPEYVHNNKRLEKNDSNGAEWLPLNQLSNTNASPLLIKILDIKRDMNSNTMDLFWEHEYIRKQ